MGSKRRPTRPPRPTSDLGLGGFFGGLGELIGKLGQLAEVGGELRREGTLSSPGGERGLTGVYGFTVRMGGPAGARPQVHPFGNIRPDARGQPTVSEEREPLVDVFDEPDHVLVVAEMPGADEASVRADLAGDVLVVSASGPDRSYRKEVLLPARFEPPALTRTWRNGIFEVRLAKGGR